MEPIKIRCWDGLGNHGMQYFDSLQEIADYYRGHKFQAEMLSTGLHDKNGKEIYEGDILSIAYDQICIGQVIFTDGGFKTTEMDANYRLDQKSILNDESEIIGNIYENPELLNNE